MAGCESRAHPPWMQIKCGRSDVHCSELNVHSLTSLDRPNQWLIALALQMYLTNSSVGFFSRRWDPARTGNSSSSSPSTVSSWAWIFWTILEGGRGKDRGQCRRLAEKQDRSTCIYCAVEHTINLCIMDYQNFRFWFSEDNWFMNGCLVERVIRILFS